MRSLSRFPLIPRHAALMVALLVSLCCASIIRAHELKPAYLDINAASASSYNIVWKTPIQRGRALPVEPRFPDDCAASNRTARSMNDTVLVRKWALSCDSPLAGRHIDFPGLDATFSDVLIRLELETGRVQTLRATPGNPSIQPAADAGRWNVALSYSALGMEHIFSGLDHLLFVVALVLLITGFRRLVETITAFTIAHSMTLAATSLGWLHLSPAPVETVIALSIVFMANELACMRAGKERLSMRRPWAVAFVFGLMHGFGFAGALAEIGLPDGEIPLALLSFNLGVEAGQLAFVVGVLLLLAVLERFVARQRIGILASYPIGIVASVWLFERVVG